MIVDPDLGEGTPSLGEFLTEVTASPLPPVGSSLLKIILSI